MRSFRIVVAVVAALATTAVVGNDGWERYRNPDFGFSLDVPFGAFETVEPSARGIRLRDADTGAVIEVYGAENASQFNPREFTAAIEEADTVREVTYRAGGRSWFVLSGYYEDQPQGEEVIFYTKFMFTSDYTRVAAFEISYPAEQKRRFDGVVDRMEDTLSRPR